MKTNNIFKNLPPDLSKEVFENILIKNSIKIERIISKGQNSAPDFLYDQDENEWIIVLQGSAELVFEPGHEKVKMHSGDYINIPAHKKHRVSYTDKGTETIWLAVFY